jgi:hypothetical protein
MGEKGSVSSPQVEIESCPTDHKDLQVKIASKKEKKAGVMTTTAASRSSC